MYSVSKDRHIAEYDLEKSNVKDGIAIISIRRIEQIYEPLLAIVYHDDNGQNPEDFIATYNSGFKFKKYSAETQLCKKTTLGPSFGGLLHGLMLVPDSFKINYAIFATENIIGITKLPLDGNPYKFCGLIAHSSKVLYI